ncbi:MAG TPA: nucleoside recognition domain-containing protein, partial [Thermoguttaceae bacterium]|nr:nucleoside recognition domain-containing protein [Thermoguttaceae bacterium]
RMTTILVAPLMTCPARLIIYTLLIAAFVPARSWFGGLVSLRGLVLMSFYLLGIMTAVVVALALKWSMLRGGPAALLMEMPAYEWPSPRAVALRVVERAWLFVRTAGTVILLVSIVVWAALYYPRPAEVAAPFAARRAALETSLAGMSADNPKRTAVEGELTGLTRKIDAAYQRQSFLARVGRAIEPVVRPLGWDWRIGAAVLASFPQREAVIATLGVIFSDDSPVTDDAATDVSLANRLQRATWEGSDRPLFTLPVALSIMVFYALCAQCVATLAVIRRETGSWRWPAFSFGYLTALAYVGALITYQLGSWLAG